MKLFATKPTTMLLLPPRFPETSNALWELAFTRWKHKSSQNDIPEYPIYQSSWDKKIFEFNQQNLIAAAPSKEERPVCWLFHPSLLPTGWMLYQFQRWA